MWLRRYREGTTTFIAEFPRRFSAYFTCRFTPTYSSSRFRPRARELCRFWRSAPKTLIGTWSIYAEFLLKRLEFDERIDNVRSKAPQSHLKFVNGSQNESDDWYKDEGDRCEWEDGGAERWLVFDLTQSCANLIRHGSNSSSSLKGNSCSTHANDPSPSQKTWMRWRILRSAGSIFCPSLVRSSIDSDLKG